MKYSRDRISVLVPTFNGEMHLHECIDSILGQTHEDFELLVVDDCSSDSTVRIVQAYAARDPRIRLFVNDHNLGLVRNWQRCIDLARSQWLKFAFQDDLLAPECLGALLDAAVRTNRTIAACRRRLKFDGDVDPELRAFLENIPSIEDLIGRVDVIEPDAVADFAITRLDLNVFGEPTTFLIHRDCQARFGSFNAHLRQSCDYEYWVRVGSNTGIAYLHDELATFRVHPSSTSSRNLQMKHFLTKFADPLILLSEYLNQPYYGNLRARARFHGSEFSLAAQRSRRIRWLLRSITAQSQNSELDTDAMLREMKLYLVDYPDLTRRLATHCALFPLERWLERTILWKFKKRAKESAQ